MTSLRSAATYNVLLIMRLPRSVWKHRSSEDKGYDYILVLPDDMVILCITLLQHEGDKRIVWGCWIKEEDDSVIYTALKNAKKWNRESYQINGSELIWDNGRGNGTHTWDRISEEEIPQKWRDRAGRYLENMQSASPPEYKPPEQGGAE